MASLNSVTVLGCSFLRINCSQVCPQARLQWKETPTLLSSPEIFCCTEPQVGVIATMGCESSNAEEVYLMLPLVWARAVAAAEQVKGHILRVLPTGYSP